MWKTRPSVLVTADPGTRAQESYAAFSQISIHVILNRYSFVLFLLLLLNIFWRKTPRVIWNRHDVFHIGDPDCKHEGERVNPTVTRKENEWVNMSENDGNLPGHYITKIAVKLPDFWSDDPDLWFLHAESAFRNAQVTQSRTKFDHVVQKLP